jgi:broad specificity phosphatase PhoE
MSEKANLYLIRSGTVNHNKLILPNGGLQQIPYNEIYTAPARRSKITARLIARQQEREVKELSELAERDKGFLPLNEMDFIFAAQPLYEDFLMQQDDLPEVLQRYHIETDPEINARLMPALETIALANLGLNVLLVTDNDILRFFLHNYNYLLYSETNRIDIQSLLLLYDSKEKDFSLATSSIKVANT